VPNMPKLAYIVGGYPGTTATFIDREIRTLRKLGVELQIVAIRHPAFGVPLSAKQRELQQDTIYLLPVSWLNFIVGNLYFVLLHPLVYFGTLIYLLSGSHPSLADWFKTFLHFAVGVYAAYLLRGKPFDQLHAHFVDRVAVVALVSSRLLNIPYSLTAHAKDIYVKPVLLRAKISEAKFITTCTAYNQAYLLQIMGDELNGKLHLAYHGLDLANYQPSSSQPRGVRPLILSVGRLTEKKGFHHLVAVCRHLKDRGYEFTCEIVGEGPQRQELETLIAQLGLEDKITLCGAIPHEAVIEKYKQAALFVLPCIMAQDGDRDGIPNVLMEAMAMQLPVVSTRHSGIPELVEDKISGLLVSPNDEVALTKALARLLDDPPLRAQLGQRGRQKVLADFDVDRNVRRLFDLFLTECLPSK
jgi:glycosyltransferase involved in cell wall biosynthesis